MSDPRKGFDPLASLFDGPDLRAFSGTPPQVLPPVEEDDSDHPSAPPEGTDPLLSVAAEGMPLAALKGDVSPAAPPRRVAMMPGVDDAPDLPVALRRMAPPLPAAPPPKPPPSAADLERAALARTLAEAAMAKAQAAKAAAVPEPPPPPAPAPAPDKAALARALAQAAMAKAPPMAQPKKAEAPKPAPKPQAPAAESKADTKQGGRLGGLAGPRTRPKSALEAAKMAAEAEERNRQEAAQKAEAARVVEIPQRTDRVLRRHMPGVAKLAVINAIPMVDREVLGALWKGHRARFAATGALAEVVATTQVIRALAQVPQEQLIAAIVETESSDYLVWVDLGTESVIAAFPDARAWYAAVR